MARTYKRDARGRFAGGGGGSGGGRKSAKLPAPTKRTATGKTKRQGLLTQRAAVSAAQAKLKSKDPADRSLTGQLSLRAQKAAVTRAKNKLAAAQKTGRIRLSGRDGVIRRGASKAGSTKVTIKTSQAPSQREIASTLKKAVRSKNIQATRILQRMAALDGHGGSVRSLTQSGSMHLGKWTANPLRKQRGNQYSAEKDKDLVFDRGASRKLITAAMRSVSAGRVSQRRFDAVMKAAGLDYMGLNQAYERAILKAKSQHGSRRRRR